ncbi:hypothetical protein [Flavobacterium sp. 5]|uniref:hypothetical protein n=1 Tax=Flavobacterium sp. 5 TaxID=2035199 RepID=UPI000C2CDD2C|nr:hypothetical protein [Flavobacterium sp. 5]PKB18378.1 hypothetical protein CLU82_3653 [Flavobacterium sp. 5]
MKQLESLMHKLNTDVYASVTVYDRDTEAYIHRNMLHEKIIKEYESAENLFETIYASGHTKLTLYPKRKNGNSFKNDGDSFDVTFGKQDNKMEKQTAKKKKKKKKKDSFGLGAFGLGAGEIIDLKMEARDKERFARENEVLIAKVEKLETENKALHEEKLERKYKVEKNEALNATIQGGLKSLPLIMRGLGYTVPDVALGLQANTADYESENLSAVQKGFIDVVKASDDDIVTLMQVIFNKINENVENNGFAIDLQELLQKYNMIV